MDWLSQSSYSYRDLCGSQPFPCDPFFSWNSSSATWFLFPRSAFLSHCFIGNYPWSSIHCNFSAGFHSRFNLTTVWVQSSWSYTLLYHDGRIQGSCALHETVLLLMSSWLWIPSAVISPFHGQVGSLILCSEIFHSDMWIATMHTNALVSSSLPPIPLASSVFSYE